MDKNTIAGFVLIAAILIGYSIYNMKQAQEKRKQYLEQHAADTTANNAPSYLDTMPGAETESSEQGAVLAVPDSSEKADKAAQDFGPFSTAAIGEEKLVTLENEQLKIVFNTKGGEMQSALIKGYETHDSLPLVLFDGKENYANLQFFINNNRVINTKDLYFTSEETPGQVTFRVSVGENKYLEKKFSFTQGKKYLLDYSLRLVGFNEVLPANANYLSLGLKRELRQVEKTNTNENSYTAAYYRYKNETPSSLSTTKEAQESLTTAFDWISFKQQFFNTTLISDEGFSSGTLKTVPAKDPGYLKSMEASVILPFAGNADQTYNMRYYVGPNHYQTLKSLNIELEDIVMSNRFLSSISSVINKWFIIPVFNWLESFKISYGIIILILTLLIKILLFPLSYKSFKSMAMMKLMQPEVNELKEKYKDDQQKQFMEQQKLFKSAGVSMMGGCLPQLLQFPILIAMYNFFPTSIELRHESFLWAHDLSTYDSILNLPFTIPFYGAHVSLFTLLMTVSSIIYAVTQPQMSSAQPGMKYMPYIFPIMLLGVFNNLPAALTYYYFLQNILSYAQQWITKKFIIDEAALHRTIQENKKKPVKKSMWQARLEELSKQQKELQKGKRK